MFCEKCGSIGVPMDGMVMCRDCGRVILNPNLEKKSVKEDLSPDRSIPGPSGSAYFPCPKCGYLKGDRYEIPPQYGDEESALFIKCSNCGFAKKEEGNKTG